MTKKKKVKVCKSCGKKYSWEHYGNKYYAKFLEHRRRRHPEQVAKARESSQRNYGGSLEEYNAQLKKQGGVCICGRPKKNVSLHQDHSHKIASLKIKSKKIHSNGKWKAYNEEFGFGYVSRSRKKAIREVRLKLRRKSRRGVLCWQCNSALKKFEDNWKKLYALANYMKYWQKKQGWDYEKKKRIK